MYIKNSNVTINVKSLEKSITFYESIGFALTKRWDNHYAQLTASGIVIGLHPSKETDLQRGSGNVSIGFTTDDFEKAKVSFQQLGIAITERKEEGGDFLHFIDPDGTSLYLIKPKW